MQAQAVFTGPGNYRETHHGSIIALDPDVASRHQPISLGAEGNGLRWPMDGKEFARGHTAKWLLWSGRHLVQIVGPLAGVLDEVRLEVRRAGLKTGQAAGTR